MFFCERLSSSSVGILLGIARPLLPVFPELTASEDPVQQRLFEEVVRAARMRMT